MEDWKVLYASKLMTADEAVRQIPDGSRVFFGHAANEPPVLVDALVRNYEQYKDVEIVHWVPMGKGEYCDPKMKGHLRHNAMFVGGPTRKAVQEGRADYTPFFFHQSTRFFSDGNHRHVNGEGAVREESGGLHTLFLPPVHPILL